MGFDFWDLFLGIWDLGLFSKSELTEINNETGYTIVEVLVALVILSIAIVPTVQFASRIITTPVTRDLITATHLARSEMEKAISDGDFSNAWAEVRVNAKVFRIERYFNINEQLVSVRIRVYKKEANKLLVELRTLRLAYD